MSSFDSELSTAEESTETIILVQSSLISSISNTLNILINNNINQDNYSKVVLLQSQSPFSASQVPPISIEACLERIFSYSKCEESSLISSLIYIDRLSSIGNVLITPYNIHRIIFASVLIAIKYNEDRIFKMKYYASIAGVSEKELLFLESAFLRAIKFNLYIEEKEYEEYSNCLLIEDKS